jgi:uncharacterized protein (TIGR02679 family)
MADHAAVRFDRPELAQLWRTLWHRYSEGTPVARVRVGPLSFAERAELADLLGMMDLPDEFAVVSVAALDAVLVPAVGLNSRQISELICGAVADRAARRAAERDARRGLWSWLESQPLVRAEPALEEWLAAVRKAGVVVDVENTRALLTSALTILSSLPADGSSLPVVAATFCGDPHALDDGMRLSTLVLKGLAAIYGTQFPTDAEQRRALWALAGVACDSLSTSVLVAGFRPVGNDPLSITLRTWADAGQAAVLTLAQLQTAPKVRLAADTLWAVENPSVVAAALNRLAHDCPPLVCTSGWPNTAAVLLLRQLSTAGAQVRYHGDFDGEGLRIAAYVMEKTSASPWRMCTADYLSAAGSPGVAPGRLTAAPWDPDLAPSLRDRGVAVYEEHVMEVLLADLVDNAGKGPDDLHEPRPSSPRDSTSVPARSFGDQPS